MSQQIGAPPPRSLSAASTTTQRRRVNDRNVGPSSSDPRAALLARAGGGRPVPGLKGEGSITNEGSLLTTAAAGTDDDSIQQFQARARGRGPAEARLEG